MGSKKSIKSKKKTKKRVGQKTKIYENKKFMEKYSSSVTLYIENPRHIIVPIVRNPRYLMNGIYFLTFKIEVPINCIDEIEKYKHKKLEFISGSCNLPHILEKLHSTLNTIYIVDTFLLPSFQVVSGDRLIMYVVLRFKFITTTEDGGTIKPLNDMTILRKHKPIIDDKISQIITSELKQYNPKKSGLLELTSKQLRIIGFPPRREYSIIDNVVKIEKEVPDTNIIPYTGETEEEHEEVKQPLREPFQTQKPELIPKRQPISPKPQHIQTTPIEQDITDELMEDEIISELGFTPEKQPIQRPTQQVIPTTQIPKEQTQKETEKIEQPVLKEPTQKSPINELVTTNEPITEQVENETITPQTEQPVQESTQTNNDLVSKLMSNRQLLPEPEQEVTPEQTKPKQQIINKPESNKEKEEKKNEELVQSIFRIINKKTPYFFYYPEGTDPYSNPIITSAITKIHNEITRGINRTSDNLLVAEPETYIEYIKSISSPLDRQLTKDALVVLLPIGVTSALSIYYYPIEIGVDKPPEWEFSKDHSMLIMGGQGSGKTHTGKLIAELISMSGGSVIFMVTEKKTIYEYNKLKKYIKSLRWFRDNILFDENKNPRTIDEMKELFREKYREELNEKGIVVSDDETNQGDTSFKIITSQEFEKMLEEEIQKRVRQITIGMDRMNIQLVTLAYIAKHVLNDDTLEWDYLYSLPVEQLTREFLRGLSTGNTSTGSNLEDALRILIMYYTLLLNMVQEFKEYGSDEMNLTIYDLIEVDPKELPEDPDGDDEVPSFLRFQQMLKIKGITPDEILDTLEKKIGSTTFNTSVIEAFKDKVYNEVMRLQAKQHNILSIFKGVVIPPDDALEPVVAKSTLTQERIKNDLFKQYTLNVVYLPFEADKMRQIAAILFLQNLVNVIEVTLKRVEKINKGEDNPEMSELKTRYPTLIFIDEAHLLFSKSTLERIIGKNYKEFIDTLHRNIRTGRKYGFGVTLITQSANDLPELLLQGLNVHFIGKVATSKNVSNVLDNKVLMEFATAMKQRWFLVKNNVGTGVRALVTMTDKPSSVEGYITPMESILDTMENVVKTSESLSKIEKHLLERSIQILREKLRKGEIVEIPIIDKEKLRRELEN